MIAPRSSRSRETVACVAVNDAFVMKAWGKSQNTDGKVEMLADGNAEYTKALGLEMDASGYGMGIRGQRFSLVVDNGVVQQVNGEQNGEFKVASAYPVLTQLYAGPSPRRARAEDVFLLSAALTRGRLKRTCLCSAALRAAA